MTKADIASLVAVDVELDGGLDAKWTPNANTAIDATINPDFSQIESDVAVITTNERFAISLPEKLPFFLESIDLFSTPITAVYTRSINDPDWGARATGNFGDTSYTALVTQDAGGGVVIMPGPNNSGFAVHDFEALDFIGRVRHDIGRSFLSLLATAREIDGGGYNRVIGPDFEWRANDQDRVSGQLLWSERLTPDRPDLTPEWNGQSLSCHGAKGQWSHGGEKWDWTAQYIDIADECRVDLGFTPQVGVREGFLDIGRTFYPKGFFSRIGEQCINLLAPEAPTSPAVRALLSSEVGIRAAEGHIGKVNRWFAGTMVIDEIEALCVELLKRAFRARYADHRLVASMIGNLTAYTALTEPGDVIMSIAPPFGGHSSNRLDGPAGVRGLKIVDVPMDPTELVVDLDLFRKTAPLVRPRLVALGATLTLFPFPLREMSEILVEKHSPATVAEDVIEFRQGYRTLYYNFDHALPPR